jgi:hypothetical protein
VSGAGAGINEDSARSEAVEINTHVSDRVRVRVKMSLRFIISIGFRIMIKYRARTC